MFKKLYFLFLILIVLFGFSGCKDFFTFNLFGGLDYVAVPTIAELKEQPAAESVADLKVQFESDSFVETVVNDPQKEQEILGYLTEVYNGTIAADPAVKVDAAIMAADLTLAASGGDQLVDNVLLALDQIQTLDTSGSTDPQAVKDIIALIVPESVAGNETAFKDMINGLLTANSVYKTLGDSLIAPAGTAADVTGGDVFNAMVTGLISVVVTNVIQPAYQSSAADVLWNLYNSSDPATVPEINQTPSIPADVLSTMTHLVPIATAAGVDLSALMGETTAP